MTCNSEYDKSYPFTIYWGLFIWNYPVGILFRISPQRPATKWVGLWDKSAENSDLVSQKVYMVKIPPCSNYIDWLFYVPFENCSLIWRRNHCRWKAAKLRPMLSAQNLWAGRDLYRAAPVVTNGFGFSGPPHLVAHYDKQGDTEDLF
jgi:hypothetical protein